jgi:hypothetical protein
MKPYKINKTIMTTLDAILETYENTKQITENQEIPRDMTYYEWVLLNDHVNNGNQLAIYEYYELKQKLDKEWVDREMHHNLYPW